MRHRIALLGMVVASMVFVGCSEKVPVQKQVRGPLLFSMEQASNAMQVVTAFVASCTPRDATTPGAEKAAQWLCQQLQKRGVKAHVQTFVDATPHGQRSFHNVLAELPGETDETIILLSHFDTKSGIAADFQGANDGASSTGLLMELVDVLRRKPLKYRILAGFLDGEECQIAFGKQDGLHGSTYLAKHVKAEAVRVKAVILMDMIGDRDLTIQVPRNSSGFLRLLALQAADAVKLREHIRLFDGGILDDHQPFLDAGFPAIDLIDFEYGHAPGLNDYWHTTADTVDKLSVASLHVTGSIVFKMIDLLIEDAGAHK